MGEHSVFTDEMLKALEEPPVSLNEVFTNVSIAVVCAYKWPTDPVAYDVPTWRKRLLFQRR